MAILEYLVVEPPTSAELEAQALASLNVAEVAAKGLLHLVIRANHEVPKPTDESLELRIRRQEINPEGHVTSVLGNGAISADAETYFQSDSIVISLSPDGQQSARAHIVKS